MTVPGFSIVGCDAFIGGSHIVYQAGAVPYRSFPHLIPGTVTGAFLADMFYSEDSHEKETGPRTSNCSPDFGDGKKVGGKSKTGLAETMRGVRNGIDAVGWTAEPG